MASVAILGASGQIGRGLASIMARDAACRLRLFARQPAAFEPQALSLGLLRPGIDEVRPLDSFENDRYDLVINAAGAGSRKRQLALGTEQQRITEALDERVLAYLERWPDATYANLSTGAIYGFGREWPVLRDSEFCASADDAERLDVYPLAKLAAEARHRALPQLRIYDIRIFGYFSRFIALDDGFFLAEVAGAIVRGAPLRTPQADMVRDYVDQAELAALIQALLRARPPNGAFDPYSGAPVGKHELLECLAREFGLRVHYEGAPAGPLAPLPKPAAPSSCRRAAEIGHLPRRSSMEIVVGELKELVAMHERIHFAHTP